MNLQIVSGRAGRVLQLDLKQPRILVALAAGLMLASGLVFAAGLQLGRFVAGPLDRAAMNRDLDQQRLNLNAIRGEMQGKVDAMPQAVAMSLLMLAGLKRDMITSAEQFLGDNYLPQRYKLPAFTMQPLASPTSPIVLTGLAAAWVKPEPETR